MIILGVDPGIATVGYGMVEYSGNRFLSSDHGAILTPARTDLEDRLNSIYDELCRLIVYYKAENMAVEELFFNTNVKTAIHVAHGRGVILLAGKKMGVPTFEYTPLQVKQAVVGYGRAEKQQVMAMVRMLLNLQKTPAAEASAPAPCPFPASVISEKFVWLIAAAPGAHAALNACASARCPAVHRESSNAKNQLQDLINGL